MGEESVFLTVSTTERRKACLRQHWDVNHILLDYTGICFSCQNAAKDKPKTSNLTSTQRDWFRFLNEKIFPLLTFLLLFMSWKRATYSKHDHCFQL